MRQLARKRKAGNTRGLVTFMVAALAMLGAAAPAAAEERPLGLTPHLHNPPPPTLLGARRQRAMSYETRLKGEIQRLERRQDAGELRRLNRVRREATRVDGALGFSVRPSFARRSVLGVVRTRR